MDLTSRKIALKVAAQHAAKQAVELAMSVAAMAEELADRPTRFDIDACWARANIAAIRSELDDLEHLIAGRRPPVKAAPAQEEAAA